MASDVCDSDSSTNQFSHSVQNVWSIDPSVPVRWATPIERHGARPNPDRTASLATMNSRFWKAA